MSVQVSGDKITFSDSSVLGSAWTGFKNRVVNGSMVVNQRGGTVTSDSGGPHSVDQFRGFGAGGGVFTMVQSSTVPTGQGFVNSCLLTVTTADSSIASGDYYAFNQDIEGCNIADLGWGTASAKAITISFWINTSVAGLYSLGICNANGTRCYPATFTVAASTWTYVTLTVAGCTDGTWSTTNTSGITLRLDLGSGSSNNGTANTWNTAGSYAGCRTTSTVNWIATSGATLYITGVQAEKGSTATSFDYRPYTTELQLAQRYAYKRLADGSVNNYAPFGIGRYYTTTNVQLYIPFPVTMRTSPSSITVGGTIFANDSGFGGADLTGVALNESSCDGATITGTTTSSGTAGNATTFYASNASVASILFSAVM